MRIEMKVSVILPTRNNEDYVADLLDSIFTQNYIDDIEVLVMDSSNDRTPEIAKTFSLNHNLRIIRVEPEDYNYGGTRNLGASITSGDILVFISTDVQIIDKNWLKKLVKNLDDPLVAGVYGRQNPKRDVIPMEEFFIKYTYPEKRKVYILEDGNVLTDFFFSNTNSAIRRDVWKKIHLPQMLISEDQEWAKRAILAGYKIFYEPNAVVYHSHNYTLKQVFKRYFDSGATLPYVYADINIKRSNFFIRGLNYEIQQFKYLLKNNYVMSIPYSILYDLFKASGYFLGTKWRYIPISIRKKLSNNYNHWNKNNDIIIINDNKKSM